MKKQTLAAAAALSLLFAASQAEALSITDTYWGAGIMSSDSPPSPMPMPIVNDGTDASDTGAAQSGDVFDPDNLGYDISKMDVSILNGFLTVKIYSQTDNYFGKWLNSTIPDAPGDLFLSTTGWNPVESSTNPDPDDNGVQNYNSDGKGVGTDWNFVVALNGLYGTNDSRQNVGTATLYSTSAGSIEYGTARNAQEAWFVPTSLSTTQTGTWSISTGLNPYLTITTSLIGITGWENVREWGLHWTMECANDVIEGSYPVPEPATVLLFGAGLAGLAVFGRRRGRN